MHDPAYELPRNPIPRTPVNRGSASPPNVLKATKASSFGGCAVPYHGHMM
jgi:hypothetical protein